MHEPSGRSFACTIIDLSQGGARMQLYAPDVPESDLALLDREEGRLHKLEVRWRLGPLLGAAFLSTYEPPA